MHSLILSKNNPSSNPTQAKSIVMCHGFGTGLGLYYKNFSHLFNLPSVEHLYALDWLGMGRSSRPKFPKFTPHPKWQHSQAIDFFVESFEIWRSRQVPQLSKFTLIGHSMGGYLAAIYALKYPQHVEKLILLSPVGIPEPPKEDKDSSKVEYSSISGRSISITGHILPNWITRLWINNITPQWLIRIAGPWGPDLMQKYTGSRFRTLQAAEICHLKDYLYHISADAASGEYALAAILSPGAWAREPLLPKLCNLQMPTTFIFGDHDWIDSSHAQAALHTMRIPAKVLIIPNAGHYLFIDNAEECNRVLENEIMSI